MTRHHYDRMINVFGQREMELAAIKIFDTYGNGRRSHPISISIFTEEIEQEGFRLLREHGWIEDYCAKESFWKRIDERT